MIEEIRPNLYRIPIPLPNSPLKELNSYLFWGKDHSLLVDTGFRHEVCRKALFDALEELRVPREELDVVLTHLHSDHAGLAPEVITGEGVIYLSEPDLREVQGMDGEEDFFTVTNRINRAEGFSEEELSQRGQNDPAHSMAPEPTDRYRPLTEDMTLEAGEFRLKPLLMPGHTPGQMCFWLEEQGILLTGDHVLFDITPNITAWPAMEDALGSYLDSLNRVRPYEGALALPGHRGRGDLGQRIDQLLEHHQRRLEEAYGLVKAQPGQNAYQLAGQMTWKIRARNWAEFPPSQRWFAVGECLSHLEHLMALGLVERETDRDGNRHYFTT